MGFLGSPRRRNVPELLDREDNPLGEHIASLKDLQGFNTRWYGTRIILEELEAVVGPETEDLGPGTVDRGPWTFLDVGTATADIPRAIVAWGRARGMDMRAVGLDLHPLHLRLARRELGNGSGVTLARGDGLRLPFRDASVDVVVCSLFLHHFTEAEAVRILREFRRVARRAVVVSDLGRSWGLYGGLWALTKLSARSPITVNDALISALRAFTPGEAAALARKAGLEDARVRRRFPFRWTLVARSSSIIQPRHAPDP